MTSPSLASLRSGELNRASFFVGSRKRPHSAAKAAAERPTSYAVAPDCD